MTDREKAEAMALGVIIGWFGAVALLAIAIIVVAIVQAVS